MKSAVRALVVVACFLALQSCFLFPLFGPDIEMYVSLGLFSDYPADPAYDGSTIEGLSNYGGKTVYFEVEGLDTGNESIRVIATDEMGWTGGDASSSTQYASYAVNISENWRYPGGTYRFRIFIDWDDSGALSTGDVVFASYTIYADTDDDPTTTGIAVNQADYGTAIVYNGADYSVDIVDPLTADAGLPWTITAMDTGALLVYP